MDIIRVFSFLLIVSFPFLQVVRCQVDPDGDVSDPVKGGDLGIIGNQFGSTSNPAHGVHTVCVFPKNTARLVPAGEETELIVGVHNDGDLTLNVISISSSLHVPFDHRVLVQNLTTQYYGTTPVRNSAQASFPYAFAVSKYLQQPGSFDLVGAIIYEIDERPYQSFFYNGTIEVVEAGGIFNMESVLLVTLGAAVVGFFGLWAYGQLQRLSMKNKNAPKVEVGTRAIDSNLDEWLQGTAYTRPLSSNKSKRK